MKSRYIRGAANVLCSLMATIDHEPTDEPVLGLVLAGGLARRMGGGDKPMRSIAGRSMLQRVIDRLAPQCVGLMINANGDATRFAAFDLAVIPDTVADFPGPLAGILAGLDWTAAHRPDIRWMLSAPGDCPFLPRDLASRLHRARIRDGARLAVASSASQRHPVVGLWDIDLRHDLRTALVDEQLRQVGRFMMRYRLATVDWPAEPIDPFFNVNTAVDITEAEQLALLDDKA